MDNNKACSPSHNICAHAVFHPVGYECKEFDGSFMSAFPDGCAALEWALTLQLALLAVPWAQVQALLLILMPRSVACVQLAKRELLETHEHAREILDEDTGRVRQAVQWVKLDSCVQTRSVGYVCGDSSWVWMSVKQNGTMDEFMSQEKVAGCEECIFVCVSKDSHVNKASSGATCTSLDARPGCS
eukprot:1158158-Pelagomonas_calceolata.AAC.4